MDIAGTTLTESFFLHDWRNKSNLALDWKEGLDKPYCVDYSSSYDRYEAELKFILKEADAERFIQGLEDDRIDSFTLSGFTIGEHIFGENVDYSSGITVKLIDNPKWSKEEINEYSIDLKVLADSVTFAGSSDFPDLNYLDPVYQAREDFDDTHVATSKSAAYIYDMDRRYGAFKSEFFMTATEYGQVLDWRRVNRANNLSLSSFGGLSKLYGFTDTGSFPYSVRIKSVDGDIIGLNHYYVEIEFIE